MEHLLQKYNFIFRTWVLQFSNFGTLLSMVGYCCPNNENLQRLLALKNWKLIFEFIFSFANVKRWLHEIDQVVMLFRCESISITKLFSHSLLPSRPLLYLPWSVTSPLWSMVTYRHVFWISQFNFSLCFQFTFQIKHNS